MTTRAPSPAAPPMILIIPQAAIESMPAVMAAGIRDCEKQYCAGTYYITVPPSVYAAWQEKEPPQ